MAEIPDSESLEPLSSSPVHDSNHSLDTGSESLSDSDSPYHQQHQHPHRILHPNSPLDYNHRNYYNQHNHPSSHHSGSLLSTSLSSSTAGESSIIDDGEDQNEDEDEDIDDYPYDDDSSIEQVLLDLFPQDRYFESHRDEDDEELTDLSSPAHSHLSFHMPDDNFDLDDFDDDDELFVGDFDDEGDQDLGDPDSPEVDRYHNVRGIWDALGLDNNNGPFRALHLMMDPAQHRPHERDELVRMEMGAPGNGRNRRQNGQPQQPPQPTVIDLTGEDAESSPRQQNMRAPRPGVNPRRRRSQQRNSPPRLARSDGSYIGDPPVINLVSDSDEEPAEVPPPRRDHNNINVNNNNNNNNNNHNNNNGPNINAGRGARNARFGGNPRQDPFGNIPIQHLHRFLTQMPHLPLFQMFGQQNPRALAERDLDDDLIMLGHRNLPPPPPAHGNIPVHLDYLAVPFGPPQRAGGAAKPAHEPPKNAKEGFTRDTGDDVVAICPSCEQELAYDPDGDDDDVAAAPARKPRTKKDKAEHHFWAVKACGHVYCKKCFDNRKPMARNPVQVGFRQDPKGTKNKMLCAVDECESEVSSKTAWVGIFL